MNTRRFGARARWLLRCGCMATLVCLAAAGQAAAKQKRPVQKPLMTQPDKVVLRADFEKPETLNKETWAPRQGTQWAIEDGVLRGKPSTEEYQASKKDHKGFEPRLSVPVTPMEFIASFSVRFSDGTETAVVPFIEFGHHVCRVKFSADGIIVLADHESLCVAEARDFRYEPGRWYHILAEMKGEEFVIQFADGPTLYAKHKSFAEPNPSGGNGLGLAGPKGGTAELDDVTLWSVKPSPRLDWKARQSRFPKFEPVEASQKKAKVGN